MTAADSQSSSGVEGRKAMVTSESSRSDPPRDDAVAIAPGGLAAEIRDALAHVRRRRGWILLATLVMALVGVGVASLMPRLFTAVAQIMIDPRGLRVFDNDVVPGGQISDAQSSLVESEARVLQSDSVLAPVVAAQHLADDPEFNGRPANPVAVWIATARHRLLGGQQPADRTAEALARLAAAVKVSRVPNSFVLELSVATRVADKSARLAQAITDEFIAEATQSREASAKRVSEGLAQRLDALAAAVKDAETAVDTFKRQNNIVDANGRPLNEQQLTDLTNRLTAAEARTGELKSRVEELRRIQAAGSVPEATSETIASSAIVALRNRFAELTQRRDNLLTSLGPRHPTLLAVEAELAGVRQLINQEVGRIAASARSDYARAEATEAGLKQSVASRTAETDAVNTAAIRLRELEREAASRRAVYESFLTRSRETREQGDLPTVNIAVISPATPPLKAGGLPAPLIVAVVAAFGASAAALLVLGLDGLAGRILTTHRMSVVTGLPLLAAVTGRRRSPRRGGGDGVPAGLRALHRALASVIPLKPPRIVLLVSITPAVADLGLPLDLARAAAEDGERVLLIDADDDRLTQPFDQAVGAERRSWTPVRPTPVPGLSVLAWSAPFTSGASDGRGGAGALRHFATDHDLLVIHAPVGPESAPLRPLAAVATTIALLADGEDASVAQIEAVRQDLGPEGQKVAGFAWVTRGGPRGGGPAQTPKAPRGSASSSRAAARGAPTRTSPA